MKIIEVSCKKCKALYETLENIPREGLACPACGSKELSYKETDREFNSSCGGGCSSCDGCH